MLTIDCIYGADMGLEFLSDICFSLSMPVRGYGLAMYDSVPFTFETGIQYPTVFFFSFFFRTSYFL